VALKFISKLGKTEKDLYFLRREIDILRKMKHENIVEMINSFETNNEVIRTIDLNYDLLFCIKIVVVTERGLADLYQLLEDDVNLPEETV
jgi:fused-like protein